MTYTYTHNDMADKEEATLYSPLVKDENEKYLYDRLDWRTYPASRSPILLAGVKPPKESVLVRTGGNALQAVNRDSLEQKNVIAVKAPSWGASPGHTILVRVPYDNTRIITVEIPQGIQPGQVFLVKVPVPVVVTGIPVDFGDNNKAPIVPSQEVTRAQAIQIEDQTAAASSSTSSSSSIPEDLMLWEEVEMVHSENQDGPRIKHESRPIV